MNLNGKPTNPGELRTKVTFKRRTVSTDAGGFQTPGYTTLATAYVKWVNAHGNESVVSETLQASQPATIWARYLSGVDSACVVQKGSESDLYEVLSVDNVRERGEYMELKVRRMKDG